MIGLLTRWLLPVALAAAAGLAILYAFDRVKVAKLKAELAVAEAQHEQCELRLDAAIEIRRTRDETDDLSIDDLRDGLRPEWLRQPNGPR